MSILIPLYAAVVIFYRFNPVIRPVRSAELQVVRGFEFNNETADTQLIATCDLIGDLVLMLMDYRKQLIGNKTGLQVKIL